MQFKSFLLFEIRFMKYLITLLVRPLNTLMIMFRHKLEVRNFLNHKKIVINSSHYNN